MAGVIARVPRDLGVRACGCHDATLRSRRPSGHPIVAPVSGDYSVGVTVTP